MTETSPESQFAVFGGVEAVTTSNVQRVVARRLTQSWTQVPHVTHHDEVDVTALDAHLGTLTGDARISPLIFLVRALAKAMAQFPHFNASLSDDGQTRVLKKYCNIGIAVDGPLGLLVPVLGDANRQDDALLSSDIDRRSNEQGKGRGERE